MLGNALLSVRVNFLQKMMATVFAVLPVFVMLQCSLAGLYVTSPESVKAAFKEIYGKNSIDNSLANFGNPPYGTTIIG
jgi:hypothetical protein